MQAVLVIVTLILLFVTEGTIIQVLVPDAWGMSVPVVPRFVLVALIYIALYRGRKRALYLGLVFGFLQDMIYGDVIGVYAFTMGLVAYSAGLVFQYFHPSVFLVTLTALAATLLEEISVYGLYQLFGLAGNSFSLFAFLPTVIVNSLFALLIYRPMNKFLKEMEDGREEEV